MSAIQNSYTSEFKAKVVLSALKETQTLEELSSLYQISSSQIVRWKKEAVESLADLFNHGRDRELEAREKIIHDLYEQLGKLKMEYEWLKKKLGSVKFSATPKVNR
jgi:transposase-like protein